MKPLNTAKEACVPTSSNCVTYQGGDIECIDICNGDSISEVIMKLADKVCDNEENLCVDNFDTEELTGGKIQFSSFKDLFQYVIDKVVELEKANSNE